MIIPITIEKGVMKLPPGMLLPPDVKNATLVVNDDFHSNDDLDTFEFKLRLLRDNPSLAFLDEEPDLYSLDDLKPENRNSLFIQQ